MKACQTLSTLSLVFLWSASALAQDAVKADPTHYKLVVENATVRVLRVDYPAGTKGLMHHHPDAIVVPLSNAKLRFTTPDGKTADADMAIDSAVYLPAVSHSGVNAGTVRIDAVLIEFKSAAPGNATLPASRPNMAMKVLAEGPRAMAYRTTADAAFQEPSGSKHDYDQVIVALGPAQMSLSIDGKPAKTTWVRGDVQFIPRGVAHESKNAGGKPVDFIIVAIK